MPVHACPNCKRRVDANARLCISCGFDFRAERRAWTRVAAWLASLGALRKHARVLAWTFGLALVTPLAVAFVASLTGGPAGRFYLPIAVASIAVGVVTAMVADFRNHGFLAAILWLAPFARSSFVTSAAVAHEIGSRRYADKSRFRQAIYVNALLACLTLLAQAALVVARHFAGGGAS